MLEPLATIDASELERVMCELEAEVGAAVAEQTDGSTETVVTRSVDLRYIGQEHFVNLACQRPVGDVELLALLESFHTTYERRYGHANPGEAIEVVNARATALGIVPSRQRRAPAETARHEPEPTKHVRALFGHETNAPVYPRIQLAPGHTVRGPAIVVEEFCTTAVPPDFVLTVDPDRNLILSRDTEGPRP
jgi:N-methylhydantoinase A